MNVARLYRAQKQSKVGCYWHTGETRDHDVLQYCPRGDVQRVQDRFKDRSLWNTKLKVFDIRFYTVNHPELFSVVKVGFKTFQDLSSKTKAIAQSI